MATDTVNCGHCQLPTYGPSFCGNCGEVLPSALKESLYDAAAKASSAGRTPMWASVPQIRVTFTDSLGANARREYLSSLEDDGTPPFIARVASDEKLVAACERDRDEAHAELREARAYAPEQPQFRALSADQQKAWQRQQAAEAMAAKADLALGLARTRLARSLSEFERAAAPLPTDLGDGLAPIDRDRRR